MAEDAVPGAITLADLTRFLALDDRADAESLTPQLEASLNAAAVLVAYDPQTLGPIGDRRGAKLSLADDVLARSEQVTSGPLAGQWALVLRERRAALRRMGLAGTRRALAATPNRPDTPVQRMFEQVVAGRRFEPADLAELSHDDLAALYTVHGWLEGVVPDLPSAQELDRALARADLLAPMRRLTAGGVVGRGRELAQLTAYLDGRESAPAPLFVHGLGGTGKSTLLAEFLLTVAVPREVPLAYLDLDRPTLRPDVPVTLLLEAVRRLSPQLGLDAERVAPLVAKATSSVHQVEPGRDFESANVSGAVEWELLDQVAGLLRPASGDRPVLLVVDTFEEAQYLGVDVVAPLIDYLMQVGRAVPNLKIIMAGRVLPEIFLRMAFPQLGPDPEALARIEPPHHRPIDLGDLDLESARVVLAAALSRAGQSPLAVPELDEVIGVVSRNPMCLQLAGRLLADEGVEVFRRSRSEFLSTLRAEKIQALLYGRILRQLHSPAAQAVAVPGLVVRRLTPEVIREVLAGPCKLDLTQTSEHEIFRQLTAEAALVEVDRADLSLRHRPDVRRAMLEDLVDQLDADQVEQIDRAAVAYYERQDGAIARAEELYHRLRLYDSERTLEERWLPEVAELLRSAVLEVPGARRVWLANRLGITLDAEARARAGLESWERQAAVSARRYLLSGRPDAALSVLEERLERSGRSPLFALHIDALQSLGRLGDALVVAYAGVRRASATGATELVAELLLKMVVIQEGRGKLDLVLPPRPLFPGAPDPDPAAGNAGADPGPEPPIQLESIPGALQLVTDAVAVSRNSPDRMLRLRAEVTRLRVLRKVRADPTDQRAAEELAKERTRLADGLDEEQFHLLAGRPVLLREAAAELGEDSPRLTALAVDTLGLEVADEDQATAFGHTIVSAVAAAGPQPDADFVAAADQFKAAEQQKDTPQAVPYAVRDWVGTVGKDRHSRQLSRSLAGSEKGTQVLKDSQDYFRAGAASSLRINWVQALRVAADQFDWRQVSDLADQYVQALCDAPDQVSRVQSREVLSLLRENRRYDDLLQVGDALLSVDLDDVAVKRAIAQALVDRGRPAASRLVFLAILDLKNLDPTKVPKFEELEARGGVGRCTKDMFLLARSPDLRRQRLQDAYEAYRDTYEADPTSYWHGINAVALLARAARDGIELRRPNGAGIPAAEESVAVARRVLDTVESLANPDAWALATICEAQVALGSDDAAVDAAQALVEGGRSTAFLLGALLRQLTEIWQLVPGRPPGDRLLPLLRAQLLHSQGGDLTLGAGDLRAERLDPAAARSLERVFGSTRFLSLQWYREGLERCRAVARIETLTGRGIGTGFLVAGAALHPSLPPQVLLTNAHVIPEGLPAQGATVVFHGLAADAGVRTRFAVRRAWWSEGSENGRLDTTVLELDAYPDAVTPVPIAAGDPVRPSAGEPAPRAYVIGHPSGLETPQFSLQDNAVLDFDARLLHYRSPTEPGSSGSPVFDGEWQLIGLHHSGGTLPRLNGAGGEYSANEGIRPSAIRDAIEAGNAADPASSW
jgi:tetratricopeptide (TPR) repeat protein/V8-like Glu-specific endopeptidase